MLMTLKLKKPWNPFLLRIFSFLSCSSLFFFESDFLVSSFVNFTLFKQSLVTSKSWVTWWQYSLHFFIDIIALNGTLVEVELVSGFLCIVWFLPKNLFNLCFGVNHNYRGFPTTCESVLFGTCWIIYTSFDCAISVPAFKRKPNFSLFSSSMIY